MLAPARSRRDTRVLVVTVATLAALLPVLVLAIAAGSSQLGLGDVVRTLIGAGTPSQELIVLELRLPRVLCGALVGAALGLAGALTQTFARNPLATPDILGVTSGAALGAVAAIVLAGGSYSVGAGALGVAALFFLYPKLSPIKIVGSDVAHAVPLTLVAGLGHWALGGVDWTLLGSLLLGSLPGIWLGTHVSAKVPEHILRRLLASMLILIGGKLIVA